MGAAYSGSNPIDRFVCALIRPVVFKLSRVVTGAAYSGNPIDRLVCALIPLPLLIGKS